jgi:hypothetical protein
MDGLVQRAFYDRHYHQHSLNQLNVVTPDGISIMTFLDVGRNGDVAAQHHSGVNAAVEAAEEDVADGDRLALFGDKIFSVQSCLTQRDDNGRPPLTDRQVLENRLYSSCRVAVEHFNGFCSALWPYIIKYKAHKIGKHCNAVQMYTVLPAS